MLRHSKSGAAHARAARIARLDHRPAERPEPRHTCGHPGCSARYDLRIARAAAGEVQSAQPVDLKAGLELHPRERSALQSTARAWLRLDWLRAMHARRQPGPARARGALVVGGGDEEGMR